MTSATALSVAAAVADRLATPEQAHLRSLGRWWPQSLAQGAAGICLLHIERARTGHASWERVQRWLEVTVSEGVATAVDSTHLYFGAPSVLLVLHHAHQAGLECSDALGRLDPVLVQQVHHRLQRAQTRLERGEDPTIFEFDAVRGLAGLGHLLMLRAPVSPELFLVLDYLVRLTFARTHPDGTQVPGWWSHVGPGGSESEDFPGGHANNGLAHGIAGPLALLSQAVLHRIRVPGDTEAIQRILTWLDNWRQQGPAGPWWPYWVTTAQHRDGTPVVGPQRPSWCYGAAGIARVQQLAAQALDDTDREKQALHVLEQALTNPAALAMIVDDSLCHGWAGHALLSHTSGIGDPVALSAPVLGQGEVDAVAEDLLAPRGPRSGIGLLEGGAGVALALHTLATGSGGDWSSFLLTGGGDG